MTLRTDNGAVHAKLSLFEHVKVGLTVLASAIVIMATFWAFGDSLFAKIRGVDSNTARIVNNEHALKELTTSVQALAKIMEFHVDPAGGKHETPDERLARIDAAIERAQELTMGKIATHAQEEKLSRVQFEEWTKGEFRVLNSRLNTLGNIVGAGIRPDKKGGTP